MQAALAKALREFADAVKAKTGAAADGEPEAQLSAPVSSLIDAVGRIVHRKIVVKAESALGKRLGIPDFAVVADGTLCGYVELKAPGEGANTSRYRGRNKAQWERFKSQPNVIYTDGNEWCVYQSGEPAERLLRFTKDLTEHGAKGVTNADAEHFRAIVTKFLAWSPIVPQKPRDQAALLAPLCRLLRDDVTDALRDPDSPLVALARDWRSLLFPDASDERFADAYAQTVTFALLLARSEGADVADLPTAAAGLEARHSLLSRALQVLTDPGARREIETSLSLLQRVINAFPVGVMQPVREEGDETEEDPWLYFYEHFLSVYDPKLRRDSGVYYTPVQVVQCQVALIDELLRNRLNRPGGFAHKDVITLDPAVGTGTYLLGVIDHALDTVNKTQGPGAVPARATTLAANVHGFEIMVGPYAVSELRVTRALRSRGADLPDNGLGVYLTDTLDSPYASPPTTPFILKPLADQHRFALNVKDKKSIIVCLGNPPYDRHEAVGAMEGEAGRQNRARTGGWVRWGEETREVRQNAMRLKGGKLKAKYERGKCILDDFSEPVKLAGHGGDLKNLYNLYVYFWRWALWKVFEHPPEGSSGRRRAGGENAGVVSFISASSYTRGDAYVGMREMLRRLCHELWIIDLGGEGRGTRRDDNVFSIQTPVAICVALRTGRKDKNEPAAVRYTRVHGTREEKYAKLAAVHSLVDLTWKPCPMDWHAPLRPKGTGPYYGYPLLNDLMPWQQSGLKVGRVWPIAPDPGVLKRRWKRLMLANSGDRGRLFKDSPTGQKVNDSPISLLGTGDRLKAISELPRGSACPELRRYAHRSYDRQWLLADARVLDRPGPPLWIAHSEQQVYFTSVFTNPLSAGPGLVACAEMPDLHHFRGSFGAKDAFPLYRDSSAMEPNVLPGLLDLWGERLESGATRPIKPRAFAAYVYALLGHPGFVEKFFDELEDSELRVPLTLDATHFDKAVALGSRLLFLHTYGGRFNGRRRRAGPVPPGKARCTKAISDKPADYPDTFEYLEGAKTLRVGTGAIAPVDLGIWEFEVSGLKVVRSWLGYRMKHPKGKKSSPLDDIHPERWTSEFTDELLRLLSILEHTLAMQPELCKLLDAVCAGPLLLAPELPKVPPAMRKPPRASGGAGLFDGAPKGDASDDADE